MKNAWIKNKTVVITGASGGLGFQMAKLLVEQYGAFVIGICRNERKMKKALKGIKKNKKNFSYRVFDVNNREKWQEFYNELSFNNTPVDVLINNAGFMLPFEKFEKISYNEIDEIIDTNFKANLTSLKTLIPLLKKSKYATVTNIISAAGLSAVVGESLYTATKFAMKGLTDTLRAEYKGEIKFTGIFPGFIKTDILQRQKIDSKNNKMVNLFMSSAPRIAKKIIKATIKHKKNLITGYDGKVLSFFGKRFPNFTASAMKFIFKISKQDLFNDIF